MASAVSLPALRGVRQSAAYGRRLRRPSVSARLLRQGLFDVEVEALVGKCVQVLGAVFYQCQHVFQSRLACFMDIAQGEARFHHFGEFVVRRNFDVFAVDPVEFLQVHTAWRWGNVFQIKPFDELFHCEELIVSVRPAQACQIVEHGFGQDAHRAEIGNGNGIAAAFGDFFALFVENHGQVAVFG